jgi:hypothetical protein
MIWLFLYFVALIVAHRWVKNLSLRDHWRDHPRIK